MPSSDGRERRWIVLVSDGRYSSLGRATDPTEAEILATEAALSRQGLSGWLAIMEGNPYTGPLPHLLEVRRLGIPDGTFDTALDACLRAIRDGRASGSRQESGP